MAGNHNLVGLHRGYATPYGCHSYGQWFGQLGDGRAISIGEVMGFKTEKVRNDNTDVKEGIGLEDQDFDQDKGILLIIWIY